MPLPPDFRVLGVDTSVRNSGVAVLSMTGNRVTTLHHSTIHVPATRPFSFCLLSIREAIEKIIQDYAPAAVAVEGIFTGKFVKTAVLLGHARGVVIATAAAAGLPIYEYEPTRVKQAVVGTGTASKHQMQTMMKSLMHLTELPPEDEGDALAIAFCHLHNMGSFSLQPPKQL